MKPMQTLLGLLSQGMKLKPKRAAELISRSAKEAQTALSALARRGFAASVCGEYRPKLNYVQDTYGGEWEDVGAPSPNAPQAPKPDNPAFAEGDPDDEIDALEKEMLSDWEKVASPVIQPIIDLAERCESFDAFQKALPSLIGKMDAAKLVAQLAQGSFAANLWGRLNPGSGSE